MEEIITAPKRERARIASLRNGLSSATWSHLLQAWLLAALVGFIVHAALTHPIEEVAHDAAVAHIYRAVVFSEVISEGVLYPRWAQSLHLGLGGPLFTFQPPLPYYALDFLYRLGIPHPFGWRVLMAGGFLVAAAGMYLLVHHLTGRRWPATVAAIAYVYAPYVIRNAFDRGSNEAFSTFLYPWVLWGLFRVAARPSARRFLVATLLWAACIGSHVLGPLMLAPVAGLAALTLAWRYRTVAPLLALLVGGLLTAFVWLPIVPEMEYVHLDVWQTTASVQPDANPIPLDQLLAAPAVFDVMRGNNGINERVGWLHLLFGLVGLPLSVWAWWRGRRELALWSGAATLFAFLLFWLLTEWSSGAWVLFKPLLQPLEFRMRLMGLLGLVTAFVGGVAVALLPPRGQKVVGGVLVTLLVVTSIPSLYANLQHRHAEFGKPITMEEVRRAEIQLRGNAFTSFGENTPRWSPAQLDPSISEQTAASPLATTPPGVTVMAESRTSDSWDLSVSANAPTTLTLNLLYYPRWQALVDGEAVPLSPQPETGYAQLAVPTGSYMVVLRYGRTLAEWAGLLISGVTLAVLLVPFARSLGSAYGRSRAREDALPERGSADTVVSPTISVASWLLPAFVTVALLFKVVYVDPQTSWFRCVSTEERVCGAEVTVDIPFVGGPRLRGYSVQSNRVAAGERLRVSLVWQAEPEMPPLHSFVHIRNGQPDQPMHPETGSEVWAQEEHQVIGAIPATAHVPGRLYWDEFWVPIPEEMVPGEYLLEIGLFHAETGEPLDIPPEAVQPPHRILWRSILLPNVTVE